MPGFSRLRRAATHSPLSQRRLVAFRFGQNRRLPDCLFRSSVPLPAYAPVNRGQATDWFTTPQPARGSPSMTHGFGTTAVNGINDKHQLVGFWGTAPLNTGFVAE